MHTKLMIRTGLAVALLAAAAMQFPSAALALNPQPEVPSKPNPDGTSKKGKKGARHHIHLPPKPIKN